MCRPPSPTMAGNDLTQYIGCKWILTPRLELKIARGQLWVDMGIITNANCSESFKFKGATLKVLKLTCQLPDAPAEQETYVLDVMHAMIEQGKCNKEWLLMLRSFKTDKSTLKILAST